MSITSALHADLRQILSTVPGLPASRAWEGRSFTPDPGTPFVRETYAPLTDPLVAFGGTGFRRKDVMYLIDVFWPSGGSLFELHDIGDAIVATFPIGRALSSGSASGRVTKSEAGQVQHEPSWAMLPIEIRGYIYHPNT